MAKAGEEKQVSKQFDNDSSICKECWGRWVKAQCKGEVEGFDKCEDFKEGCTKCLEDFCRDGKENGLCSLEKTPTQKGKE